MKVILDKKSNSFKSIVASKVSTEDPGTYYKVAMSILANRLCIDHLSPDIAIPILNNYCMSLNDVDIERLKREIDNNIFDQYLMCNPNYAFMISN